MKAVQFENQKISLIEVPIPAISDGEARVQVMMAGICATDVALFQGYQNFSGIPGHEFVGLVEAAPGAPEMVGKRVVADINVGCGECPWCRSGNMRHCPSRQAIGIRGRDGAFAEYVAVPLANLVALPEGLETIDAVFAEPAAAALEIARQVHIRHDTKIAVLGDGRMGQLCAQALSLYSSRVRMLGRHEEKLAIAAAEGVGTDNVSGVFDPAGKVLAGRHAQAFDLVVEATGSPEGVNQALQLARSEGTVVVKTTSHQSSDLDLAELVVREITLLGSRCGDAGFAVQCLANGRIKPAALVDGVYAFSEFKAAFERAASRGSGKVLLAFA